MTKPVCRKDAADGRAYALIAVFGVVVLLTNVAFAAGDEGEPGADSVAPAATKKPPAVGRFPLQPLGSSQPAEGEQTPPVSTPDEVNKGAPSPTLDELRSEARRRFDRGIRFYEEGDYPLALIEFQRAYELISNYRVLYNIGQVSIQLRAYARARRALESYLALGKAEVSPARRREVLADLQKLKSRTAFVNVETKLEGVKILIDDEPVAMTPLIEPLLVTAGVHKVELRKPGYKTEDQFITLAGGDEVLLRRELSKLPLRTVKETIVIRDQPLDTWVWVGWGATGVLAAGAVATGVLGLSAVNDLDQLRNTVDAEREALDDAQIRARRMFTAADILGLSAAAVGGVTLFFTLTSEAAPVASKESGTKPGLKVGVGPSRVNLTATF